jgi:hypothetical protein
MITAASVVGGWIWWAIQGFWNDVVNPAIHFLHDVLNYAIAVVQYAINALSAGVQWLVDHLIIPAFDWILHAAETVGRWIEDAVIAFYHDFILPFWNDFLKVWDEIAGVADFVYHEVLAVVRAVEKAWDWIIWFGEHTFDELRHLYDDIEHGGGLDAVVSGIRGSYDEGAKMLDDLASWLG